MTGPILTAVLATPAGELSLLAHADTLVAAGFTGDPASLRARMEPALRGAPLVPARGGDLAWLVQPMLDYLAGDLTAPDGLPVRQPGGPGRQRMWQLMREVPAGCTLTYTELAALAGQPQAPRAAGAACAANLIAPAIPCHRILRSDGSLGGYYYGLPVKEWLLAHEGAAVAGQGGGDGRGDMATPAPAHLSAPPPGARDGESTGAGGHVRLCATCPPGTRLEYAPWETRGAARPAPDGGRASTA